MGEDSKYRFPEMVALLNAIDKRIDTAFQTAEGAETGRVIVIHAEALTDVRVLVKMALRRGVR